MVDQHHEDTVELQDEEREDAAAADAPEATDAPEGHDIEPIEAIEDSKAAESSVEIEVPEAISDVAEPTSDDEKIYNDTIDSDLSKIVPMEHLPVVQAPVGTKYHGHSSVLVDDSMHRHHHHHHGSGRHHHHHRTSRWHRRRSGARHRLAASIAIVLAALVMIPLALGLAWILAINHAMSMGSEGDALKSQLASEADAQADSQNDGFYVMFVGSDAREGEAAGRGDVLMLTRVDPVARTISIVSIPRDTMIHIAGIDEPQKINATYAYGGASSAVYAISHYAGVRISHYAEVDFGGLERLVDRLGGVWIDVPETVETGSGTIEAGRQLLTGAQALSYARERHTATGGDFGRARAQRLVVEGIIRQVLASDPLKMPGLIRDLAGCVSTDYSVAGLVRLARRLVGGELTIYSAVCPSYAFWQDGVAYVGTMYDEWQTMMKRTDAGLDPNGNGEGIPEPQNSSEKLGSAEIALSPREYKDLAAQNMTTDVVEEVAPQVVGGDAAANEGEGDAASVDVGV